MFDEKPEDLAELAAEYHEQYAPADATERELVDALVHNEWRLRRMRRVEAELWQSAHNLFIAKNIDVTSTCTSGDAFAEGSLTFERLQRAVNSCERAYHRLVARAHGLRSPQPEQSKNTSASSASFCQNPQTPPPEPAKATPDLPPTPKSVRRDTFPASTEPVASALNAVSATSTPGP